MKGSLETRFFKSNSDYHDVLDTGVIEEAKKAAVETELRQLIDDTTAGVLILQDGYSVLCWLTGIPSSRKDYTGTKIRYAIALREEYGKIKQWAGILCELYSNQEQMQALGDFLDKFIQDNNCENSSEDPFPTFDPIADFLSKIEPVSTLEQIPADCEFVLASYLAEPNDTFKLASSKGRSIRFPSISVKGMRLQTGVFWNGVGFSEVSHHVKKKGQTLAAKVSSSSTQPKQVPNQLSNQVPSHLSEQAPDHFANQVSNASYLQERHLDSWKNKMIAGSTAVVLILLIGLGLKLNNEVEDLRGRLDALQKNYNSLQETVGEQKKALETLQNKVETLNKHASSTETGNPKDPKPDPKKVNQPSNKDKAGKK